MKLGHKKGEDKLYKQWVKHGDLSPGTTPQEESPSDVSAGREKNKQGLRGLYILLGVSIFVLGAGLVLLLIQSC